MKTLFNFLALVLLLPLPANAASLQEPALSSSSGPVSPLCFSNLNTGDVIDPDSCGGAKGLVATEDNAHKPSQGFYGTSYKFKDFLNSPGTPYIEYRHLGPVNGQEAVLARDNFGGSGVFSALYLLSHGEGGKLKVEAVVAAGDRCVGGISEASVDAAGTLSYSANLTPQGLYNLATGEQTDAMHPIVENCAACCIGTANYRDGALHSVTIDQQAIDDLQKGGEASVTQCFNRLLLSHSGNGSFTLQPTALDNIAANFRQTCQPR